MKAQVYFEQHAEEIMTAGRERMWFYFSAVLYPEMSVGWHSEKMLFSLLSKS